MISFGMMLTCRGAGREETAQKASWSYVACEKRSTLSLVSYPLLGRLLTRLPLLFVVGCMPCVTHASASVAINGWSLMLVMMMTMLLRRRRPPSEGCSRVPVVSLARSLLFHVEGPPVCNRWWMWFM